MSPIGNLVWERQEEVTKEHPCVDRASCTYCKEGCKKAIRWLKEFWLGWGNGATKGTFVTHQKLSKSILENPIPCFQSWQEFGVFV